MCVCVRGVQHPWGRGGIMTLELCLGKPPGLVSLTGAEGWEGGTSKGCLRGTCTHGLWVLPSLFHPRGGSVCPQGPHQCLRVADALGTPPPGPCGSGGCPLGLPWALQWFSPVNTGFRSSPGLGGGGWSQKSLCSPTGGLEAAVAPVRPPPDDVIGDVMLPRSRQDLGPERAAAG